MGCMDDVVSAPLFDEEAIRVSLTHMIILCVIPTQPRVRLDEVCKKYSKAHDGGVRLTMVV